MSAFATISEAAADLRSRRTSALELTNATLALLEKEGPRYNAVASLVRTRALREAASADRALARGDARPLLGIPYGSKDLLAARGAPTTWGAAPYRRRVSGADAGVIAKLKRAGAVLVAKLAMIELAGGGGYRYPSASLQGPGRNPWDTSRWSGGSSSGSGAAVGAGLVPFALGSETSGSIATPAAYCGVTGLRPTYGLVSRSGAMALSWTLDKIGPLARSAADCALVLAAIAGPDAGDRTTSGRRFRPLDEPATRDALANIRVGYAGEELERASAEARPALERGIDEVRSLFPGFVEARFPEDLPYGAMVGTIIGAEGATVHAELIGSERLDELADAKQKAGLRAGLEIRARDYLQAMRLRTVLAERVRRLFASCDLILSYGRANTATAIDAPLDAYSPPPANAPIGNSALIAAANLAGLPAVFFPCGIAADGLPVGLQVVGPPFSEPLLIAFVEAYQRATAHHLERPPAAAG